MSLNKEYKEFSEDIINNDNFLVLKNDVHHGTNKYDHCKRVSYLSFLFTKLFKGNSKEATRAGLLHDFFYGSRTSKEENDYLKHPKTSSANAKKYFLINDKEAGIIESHMYHHALLKRLSPFMKEDDKKYFKENKPKDKESVIVCVSDLLVSLYEVCAFKVKYTTSLYLIFLINLIRY